VALGFLRRFDSLISAKHLDCEAKLEQRRERFPTPNRPAVAGMLTHGGKCNVLGVLIVDDDPKTRQVLRDILVPLDHCVVEACNGREAVTLVEQSEPDLMIIDILMPEMDGLETIRFLRHQGYRMPIIAMPVGADSAEKRYSDFARSFGANDVLLKPFDQSDVLEVVERALGHRGGPARSGSPVTA